MAVLRKPSTRVAIATVGTVLSLGLLIYLFVQQGLSEVMVGLARIPLSTLLAATALMGISRVALAVRWHFALRSVDIHVPFRRVIAINFASQYACNFLPSQMGGDVVKLAALMRTKEDTGKVTASLVVDHTTGLLSMLLVIPAALPAIAEFGRNSPFDGMELLPAALLIGATGGDWIRKVRGVLRRMLVALRFALRRPGEVLLSLLASLFFLLGLFAAIQLLLTGMGERIGLLTVAGLWAFVYVASGLPISVNGIGLQEVSMSYAYATLGGVSMCSALALAVLVRLLTALWSLPGAPVLPGIMAGRRVDESAAAAMRAVAD